MTKIEGFNFVSSEMPDIVMKIIWSAEVSMKLITVTDACIRRDVTNLHQISWSSEYHLCTVFRMSDSHFGKKTGYPDMV
jgi:hypothetical protein